MNSERKNSLICEVANMYYNMGMTQAEIAKAMYISRTSISRLLQAGRDSGLIEIKIHPSSERCYYLEDLLCTRLHLKEAYIYDFGNAEKAQIFDALCERLSNYLGTNMKENSVFGISRGTVMARVLDTFKPLEPKRADLRFVQIHGCESTSESSSSSEDLVRRMLALCGGTAYYLNAPLYLKNETLRTELENEPSICRTLELISQTEVVVTGIGALADNWHETSFLSKYLDGETIQELIHLNCVGHIFGQFFDIYGRQVDHSINLRCLGIHFENIPKIPKVIAAVSGPERMSACLGAIRGKLINILFTDRVSAEQLVEMDRG